MLKINKYIKRFFSCLMLLSLIFTLCSCDSSQNTKSASVAKIPWEQYDKLLNEASTCSDFNYRASLLHKAEDMLMSTWAVLPLYYPNQNFLVKPNIKNYCISPLNNAIITEAYMEGSDTINAQLFGEPQHLAVNLLSTIDATYINKLTSLTLTKYNVDNKIVPYAAKTIDISDDKKTYTFNLRDNLKWSDGSTLNADDFVYSFLWSCDIKNTAEYRNFFEYIEGFPDNLNIKSTNDGNTFTIKLKAPCPYFLDILTYPVFMPLKKSDIEKYDSNNPSAWGQEVNRCYSGAYMVSSWKHRESMTMIKNPYFFDKDNLKTEKFNFMLSDDTNVIYNAYNNNDISFATTLSKDTISNYRGNPELVSNSTLTSYYLNFNVKSKLFAKMTVEEACKFREAINYAIDREFILNVALSKDGTIADTFVPKDTLDGTGKLFKRNTDTYTYPLKDEKGYFPVKRDLNKSRELLKSIGFKFNDKGKLLNPITIEYLTSTKQNNNVAECLQQDFLELGIRLTPISMDWTQLIAERNNGNFTFMLSGWTIDFNDPYSMLEIMKSNNTNNTTQLGR